MGAVGMWSGDLSHKEEVKNGSWGLVSMAGAELHIFNILGVPIILVPLKSMKDVQTK